MKCFKRGVPILSVGGEQAALMQRERGGVIVLQCQREFLRGVERVRRLRRLMILAIERGDLELEI
ncbi:MAG: hypothetical protein HDKAJFGB_01465 [Anaerolineae bacterium]|nr:hypothetical protein [Anaerolineae bacterium]